MKYNRLHIASASLLSISILFLSASCNQQETLITSEEPSIGETINLSASLELPASDTKTSLDSENQVLWSTGDQISVFFGEDTENKLFTLSSDAGLTTAIFTGEAPASTPSFIYAVYPYNSSITINETTVTPSLSSPIIAAKGVALSDDISLSLELPSIQTYKEDGFAEGMNPAVSYTRAGNNLFFNNLCGILKLQLKVAEGVKTITKITLRSATNKLSGSGTVAMTALTPPSTKSVIDEPRDAFFAPSLLVPVLTMSATASNSVTLDLGAGVELTTTPKTFYIVVPPITGSFTVTIYDSEGKTMTKSTSSEIQRNKIRPMPELNYAADELIRTADVTSITTAGATFSGEVLGIAETISARGFVWSTSPTPTIALDTKTIDGTATNTFTSTITGLTAGTTYYVRAYLTNIDGTFYGEQQSFTTLGSTFTVEGVTFGMIEVVGGTFSMGATAEQGSDAQSNETPVHSVTLSTYSIGQCEVTQGLWKAVMGSENNPSKFKTGDNYPVEQVSWTDCNNFITELNKLGLTTGTFALPTEAQWEYAARGGQTGGYKYSGSNTIGDVAWYKGNTTNPRTTLQVGTKAPNQLGIYDMSGNVIEWCRDKYAVYSPDSQTDPIGPDAGTQYIVRGGNFFNGAIDCRITGRYSHSADYEDQYTGLRLVLVQ